MTGLNHDITKEEKECMSLHTTIAAAGHPSYDARRFGYLSLTEERGHAFTDAQANWLDCN